jgi:EAL and modified HD-GYP domain-containing signal transduction protein
MTPVSHEMTPMLVGRQPICTADERIQAYELLHRRADGGPPEADGDRATAEVVLASIVDIGLDTLVGPRPAFINVPRASLLSADLGDLEPERVVLEILETVSPDDETLAAVRSLSRRGYRLALDDYVPGDRRAALLPLVSIVKFDVRAVPAESIARELARIRRPGLTLVAEKVEALDEVRAFRDLGFDWFQGYYFGRPELVAGRAAEAAQHAVLELLAHIQDPSADADVLASCVQRDVGLAYRLVRYVNAASHAPVQPIQEVRDAVLRLGRARIRNLAALMLLAGTRGATPARVSMAMMRARMCELLARREGLGNASAAFMVGLFSCLDALLGAELEGLLRPLPLDTAVADAILRRRGPLGEVLDRVVAYERCDWERAIAAPSGAERVRESFVEAARWSREIERSGAAG